MTALAQLVWDCKSIGGMDKLVLMGWAEQVPDGSDLAYASKETVAEFLELGISTVQRHTKELLKRGVLIDTGGRKQWKFGWTPVYQVNLELLVGQPFNVNGCSNRTPIQSDLQGSNGSRFSGSRFISSSGGSSGSYSQFSSQEPADQSNEVGKPENPKPETIESKPEPSPTPMPKGKPTGRVCPDCKEPLYRDINHFLSCPVAKGRSELDEYLGDMLPRPNPNYGGEVMEFEEWQLKAEPLCLGSRDCKQNNMEETERQKTVQGGKTEGKATANPAQPPVAPTPLPECEFCNGPCTCDIPAPPPGTPWPSSINP